MENLSLSVPDLLQTVKNYVGQEKHNQLDEMLHRYTSKQLGKQQVRTHHCAGRLRPPPWSCPATLPHAALPEVRQSVLRGQ